jgi:hypothetical protein
MFGSINIAQSNKIKTELVGLGLTKDKASQYVSDLGSAKDETERKVLSEQISDVINERIGERVAPLLKDTPVEPEINIQAGNEKPFDSRGEIEALLKENGLESDFDIVETAEGKFIAQQKGTEDTPAIETESQQAEQAPAQEAPRQEQQTPQPIITEPITEEDAQVFGRRFPTNESVDAEFEQSEQTDLFKKLIRGDKPALLQYNQNLAGVAPEIETPANDQQSQE